jgi:hypothetical protein
MESISGGIQVMFFWNKLFLKVPYLMILSLQGMIPCLSSPSRLNATPKGIISCYNNTVSKPIFKTFLPT